MPRASSTRQKWDKDAMKRAIAAVQNGDVEFWKASKTFSVPKTTLRRLAAIDNLPLEQIVAARLGRPPALPPEIETNLVEYILQMKNQCGIGGKPSGRCISIRNCTPMTNFLEKIVKPYPPYIVKELNSYSCGFKDGKVHVCCPSTPINIVDKTKPTTPAPKLDSSNESNHSNLKLLPNDCGYLDINDKIRNGIKATLNEFPWMALLQYQTDNGPQFKCGGSIINDRYILTAAHCLNNLENNLIGVRIGEYDILSTTDCETQSDGSKKCNAPVQNLKIEEVIPHPEYNSSKSVNDIGLVRVTKMNLTIDNARPVCLPLDSSKNERFRFGVVTGWGYTSSNGEPSAVLQRLDVPVFTLKNCRKAYRSQPNVMITSRQICAGGTDQKGFCFGDSGGPLQIAAYVDGDTRYVQQGVVSFGPKYCGYDGIPGVYARVAYYMNWILDQLKP